MLSAMKKLTFRTTINCQGCVKAVTPFLNDLSQVTNWEVDTNSETKTLTIEGENLDQQAVIEAVEFAGFDIEVA